VQSNKVFLRLLGLLSKRTGMSLEDLHSFVEEIVRLCWKEVDSTLASSDGQQAPMQAEMARLKKQMAACNLSAQRQIEQMRLKNKRPEDLSDDAIVFHEPLQYLDESTRDLVLSLVIDKVKLVEGGNVPPSLVEALASRAKKKAAQEQKNTFTGTLAEQFEQLHEKMLEVTEELKESRAMHADVEEAANVLRRQLQELTAADLSPKQRRRMTAELRGVQGDVDAQLEDEDQLEELQEELQGLRQTVERQQEEGREQAAEILELQAARAQVDVLEEELMRLRCGEGEVAPVLTEPVLREEVAVETREVQTTLMGDTIADSQSELTRHKVMLEEMQMKFKELLERCKKKGITKEIEEVTVEMGIVEVFSHRAVFQRLFEDAQRRADKLDRIRDQLKIERQRTLNGICPAEFPSPTKQVRRLLVDEAGEVPAVPVMQAVAESELPGLHKFYAQAEVRHPSSPSGGPLRPPPPMPELEQRQLHSLSVAELPSWVCNPPRGSSNSTSPQGGPLGKRRLDGVTNAALAMARMKLLQQSAQEEKDAASKFMPGFGGKAPTLQTSASLPSLPPSRLVPERTGAGLESRQLQAHAVAETHVSEPAPTAELRRRCEEKRSRAHSNKPGGGGRLLS